MRAATHPISEDALPEGVTGNFTFVCVMCGMTVRVIDTVEQPHECVPSLAVAWDRGWAARAEYDHRKDVPLDWPDLNPYREATS